MKKVLSILMTVLVLSVTAACGSANPESTATPASGSAGTVSKQSQPAEGEKPTKLTIVYMSTTSVPADIDMVAEAVSEITRKSINVEVELVPINWGSYNQQVQLMLSGNEKVDLFVTRGQQFFTYYTNNQLVALDELIDQYGAGIKEVIEPNFLNGGRINNQMYGITTNRDLAVGNADFLMRKDILDKYGIAYSERMTKDDIGAIYKKVQANEPEMLMLAGYSTDTFYGMTNTFDDLGDGFAVLENFGKDNLTVVNKYKTDGFVNTVELIRSWYDKGFISKDITSETEPGTAQVKAGRAFSYLEIFKPGITTQSTKLCGYPMVAIQTQDANSTSTIVQSIMWSIPRNCENPEKAMQYLNEVYTSKELMNLLSWGIKDTHYVETEDGHTTFPEGVTAENSGYNMAAGWLFGNQYLTTPWEGDDLDIWDQMKSFNNNAVVSKAMGFSFDTTNVVTEIAAITNVYNEYVVPLCGGVMNPEEALPQLYEALDNAGIQKLIDEKQAQLDAWAAEQ